MFGLFGPRKSSAARWPWNRTPKSGLNAAVDRFLTLTARLADDTAVAIDGDVRQLIADLAPADQVLYESIVRVPGAFPPYLVWAVLTAIGAEPISRVLEAGLARRVETRILETAALTRGKSNARLLSALLYRAERAAAAAQNPGGQPGAAFLGRGAAHGRIER